jgi:DnaJ-class molecular chaperone with C-terminal Zn finger domain
LNTYQCYQALGLQEGASIKEVKSAYRKLALQFHPDKNSSDQESTKFKTVTEAYQILRAEYKNVVKSYEKYNQESKKRSGFTSGTYSWGARHSDRNPMKTGLGIQNTLKMNTKIFGNAMRKPSGITMKKYAPKLKLKLSLSELKMIFLFL